MGLMGVKSPPSSSPRLAGLKTKIAPTKIRRAAMARRITAFFNLPSMQKL